MFSSVLRLMEVLLERDDAIPRSSPDGQNQMVNGHQFMSACTAAS